MADIRIQRCAQVLVHYSVKAREGEEIAVRGTVAAQPLILAVYEELIRTGAYPRVRVSLPGLDYAFFRFCKEHQLEYVSEIDYAEAKTIAGLISIESDINTRELSGIDPGRITRMRKAREKLSNIIQERVRWNVTLFPTHALAQEAEMSLREYEDFVFGAMFLDDDDPVARWEQLSREQEHICGVFNQAREVRIVGQNTDLTMSVGGRIFINSDGTHNMPSGEVFSAPVEDSVNGHISFEYPVCLHGQEVEGVFLRFEQGRVVHYEAKKNQAFLEAMLNTDQGARYVGEIGIGNNYGINRFTKNILFDEKIGGSIHIAVGRSYEECGGKNESAIHWDMIKDLRQGGAIYLDGSLVQENGKFLV